MSSASADDMIAVLWGTTRQIYEYINQLSELTAQLCHKLVRAAAVGIVHSIGLSGADER